MRKTKAKATAKVDALLAEPFTNDEEFMQRIVDQAQAESMRRMDEQPVKTKKKGLWRGAPALCALVIILLVAPILAVIVNPVCFSKANQLVRKATIWVNDTFKLGIELPVEEGKNELVGEQVTSFSTIEEAIEYTGTNILVFDEKSGCELKSVEVTDYYGTRFIALEYQYDEQIIHLNMETISDRIIVSPPSESATISSQAGELWMWSIDAAQRAIGYIDEWYVDVSAPVNLFEARLIFEHIKWFN